jgi:hypothetical protein
MKKKEKLKNIVNLTPNPFNINPISVEVESILGNRTVGSGTVLNPSGTGDIGAKPSCFCWQVGGGDNCWRYECNCVSGNNHYHFYYTNCATGNWHLVPL